MTAPKQQRKPRTFKVWAVMHRRQLEAVTTTLGHAHYLAEFDDDCRVESATLTLTGKGQGKVKGG